MRETVAICYASVNRFDSRDFEKKFLSKALCPKISVRKGIRKVSRIKTVIFLNLVMTLPSIGKLYLILGICLSIVHRTIQIEDADDIFETVAILSQKVMKLEALLSQQDECNCNLTEIEEHIRQNGINVAKNRHDLLVFRDGLEASIQEVSDIFYVSLHSFVLFYLKQNGFCYRL